MDKRMKLKYSSDLRWNSHCGHGQKTILNYKIHIILVPHFTKKVLTLVKAILPDKNLIRQNLLREYKNFIIEVGVRRKEGVKSQKTYKYKK